MPHNPQKILVLKVRITSNHGWNESPLQGNTLSRHFAGTVKSCELYMIGNSSN